MKDLIYRQAAIDKFEPWLKVRGYSEGELNMLKAVLYELRFLPSAQPENDEWCTDCKEYDKERHCCPRFNKVIRTALQDAQPETAKRIVGKSRDGMTLWYQCDMCNEPVDENDLYCRGCGRRFEHGSDR